MVDGQKKRKLKHNKACVYCGCNFPLMLTIDHKVPKSRGGQDDEKNAQVTCWFCNQLKGNLCHDEFLKYRRALNLLYELEKVRIQFPNQLPLLFRPTHYPDFQPKLPIEKQPLKNERQNGQTPVKI